MYIFSKVMILIEYYTKASSFIQRLDHQRPCPLLLQVIQRDGSTLLLAAPDAEQATRWIKALNAVVSTTVSSLSSTLGGVKKKNWVICVGDVMRREPLTMFQ